MNGTRKKVLLYSVVELLAGLVFWIWAIVNSARQGFDSGVVVFLFAIFGGASGLVACQQNSPTQKLLNFHLLMLVLAHLFIGLAYVGGAALAHTLDKSTGWVIYCVVFALLWFASAYPVIKTARKFRDSHVQPEANDQTSFA